MTGPSTRTPPPDSRVTQDSASAEDDSTRVPGRSGRRIFSNFSFLSGAKVLGDMATFALFVLLSRLFGEEGIGAYSFAIALTGIFAIISELGTNLFTIREVSRAPEAFSALFGRILSLRVALALLASGLLVAILPILPFPIETLIIIVLVGGYQVCYQLVMGFAAAFLAHNRGILAGALEGSFKAATAIGAIAVAIASGGLLLTVSAMPLVACAVTLIAYMLVRRRLGRPHLDWSWPQLRRTCRDVLPYGLFTLFTQIQQRLDVTLVGLMIGAAAAGVYNVAYRLVFMVLFIPHFLALSILPVATRLHGEAPDQLGPLYHRSVNVTVLLGLPAAAGIWLVAPDLLPLVFGNDFVESVSLLRLLAWLFVLSCPRIVMGKFLVATGHEMDRTRAQWRSLLVALPLFLLLVSQYGPTGAAFAVLATEALLLALFAVQLRPIFGWPRVGGRLLMGSVATASFFCVFTAISPQPLLVVVLGSMVLYSAMLLSFRQIRSEELPLALGLLRRRANSEPS